jgi:class 3 adenylate cyclase
MVAGSLGKGERMEFCLLGDTANVGARLEQLGKQHGGTAPRSCTIILGEPSWRLLEGSLPGLCIGEVSLRNRAAPMSAWRIDSDALASLATPAEALRTG